MQGQARFIVYTRVSTARQGASGLGLEAQRAAVASYLAASKGECVKEFQEVETGKGADALERRPELRAAIAACRKIGCTLLIAKLDRLARNVHFVSGLIETGVDFIAADMPAASKAMVQMHAVMSEWERDQIAARTKAALAAAKMRGVVLGKAGPANLRPNIEARQQASEAFAERVRPVLVGLHAQGLSQRAMAEKLNELGLKTARGAMWTQTQVQRVLARLSLALG